MHVHFIKNFVCTRQSKSEVEAGRVVSESKTAQAAETEKRKAKTAAWTKNL
jgi:hypothetical protein